MTKFSGRLTHLRERRNWSKTTVARHLGIGLSTYANWEYGVSEPDMQTVEKLAALFGVSADYLISGVDRSTKDGNTKPHEVDIEDKDVLFTYRGKPLSDEDRAIIERLMNGKADE